MLGTNRSTQFGVPVPGKETPSSRRGRVCESVGCSTILSVYNHSSWCSIHEQPVSRLVHPASVSRSS